MASSQRVEDQGDTILTCDTLETTALSSSRSSDASARIMRTIDLGSEQRSRP